MKKKTIFDTEQEKSIDQKKQVLGTQKTKKGRYTLYLTDDERAKLETIANKRATSLTQVIRDMINEYPL